MKKICAILMMVAAKAVLGLDLAGVAHTVTAEELAANENFTNTGSDAELTFAVSEAATYSGVISGNIKVIVQNMDEVKLTFASANSYTLGTEIQSGYLGITDGGALGAAKVTVQTGAQLALDAATTCPNDIDVPSASSKVAAVYFGFTSGTGCFSGNITASQDFYPSSAGKATHEFRGTVSAGRYVGNGLTKKGSVIRFYGPVVAGTELRHYASNLGVFYLYSAENDFPLVQAYSGYPQFLVAGAVPRQCKLSTNGGNYSYSLYFVGDQTCDHFQLKSNTSTGTATLYGNGTVLTCNSTADVVGKFVLNDNGGSMGLVWNPADNYSLTILGGTSTMSGALVVNGGNVVLQGGTFSKVSALEVNNAGRLEIGADAVITPSDIKVSVAADAHLSLSEGRVMQVAEFTYGGTRAAGGKYYQGAAGTQAGAVVVAQIEGAGCIYVPQKEVETEQATWDAGGADTLVTTAANWQDDVLPDLTKGGLLATFGAAGQCATVPSEVSFKGLVMSATEKGEDAVTNVFSLSGTGLANLLSEGVQFLAPNVGEAHVYNFALPLNLQADQAWTFESGADVQLNIMAAISADTAKLGITITNGVVNFRAPSMMAGPWNITNATINVFCNNAFGVTDTSDPQTVTIQPKSCVNFLADTTQDKKLKFRSFASNSGPFPTLITTAEGTTTKLLQVADMTDGHQYVTCGAGGVLEFAGGLNVGGYMHFNGAVDSRIILSGAYKGGNTYFDRGIIEFAATGNDTHWNKMVSMTLNGATIRTTVEHAFWTFTQYSPDNNARMNISLTSGTWDLCGCDQGICGVDGSKAAATITSQEPAVLYLHQYAAHTLAANVMGQAGISKRGTATLTLDREYDTTGSLEVTQGELVLGESGVWHGTSINVGEAGTLTLNAKANLAKGATLNLAPGGTISIASGVTIRVSEYFIDGVRQKHGSYILGAGTLVVGDPSTTIFIR